MTKQNSTLVTDIKPSERPALFFPLYAEDVVAHPTMTAAEKAALLASWASDARAVKEAPALRQLDNGAVVEVNEILRALRTVAGANSAGIPPESNKTYARMPYFINWHGLMSTKSYRLFGRKRKPDDDDNNTPPSCLACAVPLGTGNRVSLEPKWA